WRLGHGGVRDGALTSGFMLSPRLHRSPHGARRTAVAVLLDQMLVEIGDLVAALAPEPPEHLAIGRHRMREQAMATGRYSTRAHIPPHRLTLKAKCAGNGLKTLARLVAPHRLLGQLRPAPGGGRARRTASQRRGGLGQGR